MEAVRNVIGARVMMAVGLRSVNIGGTLTTMLSRLSTAVT